MSDEIDELLNDVKVDMEVEPEDSKDKAYSFLVNCLNIDELNDSYQKGNVRVIKAFKQYLKQLAYTDITNKVLLVFMLHEVSSIVGYAEADLDQIGADSEVR